MQSQDDPRLSQIPPLVQQILADRGLVSSAELSAFLFPDYDRDLLDPMLLKDMSAALARIAVAVAAHEQVAVYGDYDIDGITATAVLCEGLRAQGLDPIPYIPDRFEEGYGINQEALSALIQRGVTLVISVDCGITSVAEVAWAREHGLDVIVTDHHAVPPEIPAAVAVINPKQPDDMYPFKELAGVGVAFKLVQALAKQTGRPAGGQEKWLLDLVAFGTVCDVVSLTGENRALVYFGLKVMARSRRVGLRALAAVAGVDLANIRAHHLGFMLGPRMNAAGRLEHAAKSLELMQLDDWERAEQIAAELDQLNTRRRSDQQQIVESALRQAADRHDDVLVLADPDWSHGIVGIAASKVAEEVRKPVLVAQIMGETTKGSARSVPGFDIIAALRAQPGLFTKFGGHAFAAGFTLPTERLPLLQRHLNEYWQANPPVQGAARYQPDVQLTDFTDMSWPTVEALAWLEPFGSGNPEPLFEVSSARVERATAMGAGGKHVRLSLQDSGGRRLAAVGFGFGSLAGQLGRQPIRLIGTLNKNEYQGTTSLQFLIKDLIQ